MLRVVKVGKVLQVCSKSSLKGNLRIVNNLKRNSFSTNQKQQTQARSEHLNSEQSTNENDFLRTKIVEDLKQDQQQQQQQFRARQGYFSRLWGRSSSSPPIENNIVEEQSQQQQSQTIENSQQQQQQIVVENNTAIENNVVDNATTQQAQQQNNQNQNKHAYDEWEILSPEELKELQQFAPSEEEQQRRLAAQTSAEATLPVPKGNILQRAWKSTKEGLVHYWHGTKQLGREFKDSAKIIQKSTKGKEQLSRREKKQVFRSVGDAFRLVPLIVIVAIPFTELILPFLLKLFPKLLPSTFAAQDLEAKHWRKKFEKRVELAKKMQRTFQEMIWHKLGQDEKELSELMTKVMQNERLSHREILRISEEFKSDLDMKKLPRQFMIDLAVYLNYPRYLVTLLKTDIIAFLLRATFNRILEDDLEIRREGIANMELSELQEECRERGLGDLSVNVAVLRTRLADWLRFSLDYKVPVSMLIVTRSLLITAMDGSSKRDTAVSERMRDFPAELVDEIKGRLDDALEYDPDVRKEMIRFLRRHHLLAQWDPSKLTAEFQTGILDFLDGELTKARGQVQDLAEVDSVAIRDAIVMPSKKIEEKQHQQFLNELSLEILKAKLTQLEQFRAKQVEMQAENQMI